VALSHYTRHRLWCESLAWSSGVGDRLHVNLCGGRHSLRRLMTDCRWGRFLEIAAALPAVAVQADIDWICSVALDMRQKANFIPIWIHYHNVQLDRAPFVSIHDDSSEHGTGQRTSMVEFGLLLFHTPEHLAMTKSLHRITKDPLETHICPVQRLCSAGVGRIANGYGVRGALIV